MTTVQAQAKSRETWPLLLRIWFLIQIFFISFDATFVLLRPYSFPDGPLGFMFPIYHIYMAVDKVYADHTNSFGWAMSTMCLVENALLAYAMFVLHPKDNKRKNSEKYLQYGDILALVTVCMQLGKSLFYWGNDFYGGFTHVKHNTLFDLVTLFIIPNAIWLVAPIIIIRNYFYQKIVNTVEASSLIKAD